MPLLGDPVVVAANWLAVLVKAGLGLRALATVQSWGQLIPRRLLLVSNYFLWDPWWILGGMLFLLVARLARQPSRAT